MARRRTNAKRAVRYPVEPERLHVSGLAGLPATSGRRLPTKSACTADSGRYSWQRINVCVDYRYNDKNVTPIRGSKDVVAFIRRVLPIDHAAREHMGVVALDRQNAPLGLFEAHIGGVSQSVVDITVIFQPAMALFASGIILFHNHPSGDATPSPADNQVTRRCVEAGKILGVAVLDHVVIGRYEHWSYLDSGQMPT